MNSILRKYFKGDVGIWWIYLFLCMVSTIVMYSASSFFVYRDDTAHWQPVMSHAFFLLVGGVFAWLLHFCSVKVIRLFGYIMAVSFFIALCLMYVDGIGVRINGALRWVHILFTFQPAEGAKLGLVLVVADLLSRLGQLKEKKVYWAIVMCTGAICLPILPSNLSTALLIAAVIFLMLLMSDLTKKWLRLGVPFAVGIALCVALYFVIKEIPPQMIPKPMERVTTWVNRVDRFVPDDAESPQNPLDDMNRQITHGKIAIARGGLFGVGPGNSIQRDYVSLAFADSIFTIIVEEYGLIGGVFVLMLYLALFFRVGRMAIKSGATFTQLASIGLTFMLIAQVLINVWVVVGLMPVTGQVLPLIGHGGTSIIITSLYIGVLLALSNDVEKREEEKLMAQEMAPESAIEDEVKVIELDEEDNAEVDTQEF